MLRNNVFSFLLVCQIPISSSHNGTFFGSFPLFDAIAFTPAVICPLVHLEAKFLIKTLHASRRSLLMKRSKKCVINIEQCVISIEHVMSHREGDVNQKVY